LAFWQDSSIRTAALHAPYSDDPSNSGIPQLGQAALNRMPVERAREDLQVGLAPMLHVALVTAPKCDPAVCQPWRMALSYLRDAFGPQLPDVGCLRVIPPKQLDIVNAMIANGLQTVETSSCGRLFGAVAALVGLSPEVTFEGPAAIALESIACPGVTARYKFTLHEHNPMTITLRPVIVNDLATGVVAGEISARFHNPLNTAHVEPAEGFDTPAGSIEFASAEEASKIWRFYIKRWYSYAVIIFRSF